MMIGEILQSDRTDELSFEFMSCNYVRDTGGNFFKTKPSSVQCDGRVTV